MRCVFVVQSYAQTPVSDGGRQWEVEHTEPQNAARPSLTCERVAQVACRLNEGHLHRRHGVRGGASELRVRSACLPRPTSRLQTLNVGGQTGGAGPAPDADEMTSAASAALKAIALSTPPWSARRLRISASGACVRMHQRWFRQNNRRIPIHNTSTCACAASQQARCGACPPRPRAVKACTPRPQSKPEHQHPGPQLKPTQLSVLLTGTVPSPKNHDVTPCSSEKPLVFRLIHVLVSVLQCL